MRQNVDRLVVEVEQTMNATLGIGERSITLHDVSIEL